MLTSRPRWPADIHERLHAASVNARELGDWSVALRERAIIARLSSRPRGHFARVVGTLRGLAVTGLVRKDGGLAGHPELLKEACRPSAGGPREGTPLLATFRLARTCDSVASVALIRAGERNADIPASAVMHRPNGEHAPFSAIERDANGDHLVFFFGELDLATAALAEEALVRVAGSTVILDLSGLTFIDASGLQAIVNAKQHIEAEGNKFRVRGAVGIVRRIFDVTSLSPWLED